MRVMPLRIGEDSAGRALIPLHVRPRARRAGVAGLHGESLKLLLKNPPLDGRANAEAVGLLAKLLGVTKNRVELVRGFRGREKLAAVTGLTVDEVRARLTKHLESA